MIDFLMLLFSSKAREALVTYEEVKKAIERDKVSLIVDEIMYKDDYEI